MRTRIIRIMAFAASLLIALLATAPASAAVHNQAAAELQAGKSSVYHFDVAATDTHGSGKLMINVDQQKFVFNGKNFDPNRLYALYYVYGPYYLPASSADLHLFASAVATPSGNLHIAGTWDTGVALLTEQGFGVGATGSISGTLRSPYLFVSSWGGDSYTLSGFTFPSDWSYPVGGAIVLDNCSQIITITSKTTYCDGTVTVGGVSYTGRVSY